MDKKIEKFNNDFSKRLGELVKKERAKAIKAGITDKEYRAITATFFHLLGKHWERFTEEAGLKIKK